ncbi:MAG: PD-(D/E)XK nuclease family protein [Enterobacterales bacterium]|nr:PD-(D/E)XK nuclease family protein [Enterobacterales bacterium]
MLDLGPFKLNLKLDRLDYNQQHQLQILDYKTGQCHLRSWFSARPTEAQMPAYYLASSVLDSKAKNNLELELETKIEPELKTDQGLKTASESTIASMQYAKIKTGEIGRLGFKIIDGQLVKLEENKKDDKNYFSKLKISSPEDLKKTMAFQHWSISAWNCRWFFSGFT